MRSLIVCLLLWLPAWALAQTIDTPPRPLSDAQVVYPEAALAGRPEAQVLLLIDIDTEGAVTRVEVAQPSALPELGFEAAAKAAVETLRFEPAKSGGAAIAVRVQYLVRFVPPPLPEPSPPDVPSAPVPEPAAATAEGPTGELTGSVLERGTRSALPGVTVVIEKGSEAYQALTNESGRFTFYDLAPGSWLLTVRHAGYLDSKGGEAVVAGEQTEVKLYLERTADNPYDVLVEAAAPKREVTRHRLAVKEAQSQPGSFGDPLLAVQNLPGVAVQNNTGDGGIAMRGAASDESAMYLDGFRIPLFYHFIGLRSVIAPGMLDSIDLYPGGAPVNYGRQTGGVLEARLKRLSPDRLHGYVDISLLDAGAFIEAPLGKKVAIAAAARVSYIDRVMGPLGATIPRYDDYQLMLTARPTQAQSVRLFYLGSDDVFKMDTDELREESAQVTFGNLEASARMQHVALEHEYTPSTTFSNRARVGFLHWNNDTELGNEARVHATFDAFLARDTLRYAPATWFALETGIDAELGGWGTDVLIAPPSKEGEGLGYVDFEKERRAFSDRIDNYAVGAFASFELRPTEDLLIVPGVRSDLQPQIEDFTFDPRVSVRYQAFERVALKAGTGVHHGVPSIDEAAPRFGNPNLGAERSLQHSVGVEVKPIDELQVDLTGFYHQLDGLAARSDKLEIDGEDVTPLNYESTGEGRAYGLELMLRKQLSHRLSGFVAYTLSRSERRRVSSDDYRLFDADQTHNLVLLAAYHLPRHWQLSTRFRFRTGQPLTPIVGSTFVSDNDEYAPILGRTNSGRYDSFHQLDVRVDKAWVFDTWSFSTYLDVQNAYNRKNGVDVAYNFDYSKSGKVSSIPILTIVGVKAEY